MKVFGCDKADNLKNNFPELFLVLKQKNVMVYQASVSL